MEGYKTDKAFRLLQMHELLTKGEPIIKEAMLGEFGVPTKTFQRDIDSLRQYYSEQGGGELIYDRKDNCYRLKERSYKLTKQEVFAVCKVLIESRAFNKEEFDGLIQKLLLQLLPEQRLLVKARIGNERVNYLPLQHGKALIDTLWMLANLITEQRIARIWYVRQDKTPKDYRIKSVGILFSEFYFYLIAWMADDTKDSYTVFRVDRVAEIEATDERFDVPYAERFSEAEFRKRVQFMYPGKLKRVKFVYRGSSIEAVLDKLPTAQIVGEDEDGYALVTAESYGNGIDMWLKSQGDWIKIDEHN